MLRPASCRQSLARPSAVEEICHRLDTEDCPWFFRLLDSAAYGANRIIPQHEKFIYFHELEDDASI